MRYLCASLLLLSFLGACKKDNIPFTYMTVYMNGDSVWTVNNVVTYPTGKILAFYATEPVSHSRMKLSIYNLNDRQKIYDFEYQGVGVTPNGNSAYYEWGSKVSVAATGSINITKRNAATFEGTYHFMATDGRYITGSFIARNP